MFSRSDIQPLSIMPGVSPLLFEPERNEDEHCRLIDTVRFLGIPHDSYIGNMPKEPWQELINRCGYNVTSGCCNAVIVGDVWFVYTYNHAWWTYRELAPEEIDPECPETKIDDEKGHGPRTAFLFAYNKKTQELMPRIHIEAGGKGQIGNYSGIEALARQYGFWPLPQSVLLPKKD